LFLYSFSVLVIFYVQQLFGFGEEVVLGWCCRSCR
jgi:hypothetical protein